MQNKTLRDALLSIIERMKSSLACAAFAKVAKKEIPVADRTKNDACGTPPNRNVLSGNADKMLPTTRKLRRTINTGQAVWLWDLWIWNIRSSSGFVSFFSF